MRTTALLCALLASAAALAQDAAAPASESKPIAGMANDLFFLRSPDDAFQLFITGRGQFDVFGFQQTAPGAPNDGFVLRRTRVELMGVFYRDFEFQLAGEWAGTPIITDAYVVYSPNPMLRFQMGQYDAPFTMENRTSDKWFDFMERSLTVRAFGFPDNKAVGGMLWGNLRDRLFYYSVGFFNGDGQNQRNLDKYGDVIGRAFVRPFAWSKDLSLLSKVQVGGSYQSGFRHGFKTALPSITTQGGFAYFNTNAGGTAVFGDGGVEKFATEFWAPIDRLDIKFEWVHNNQALAELQGSTVYRNTRLDGGSLYAQVGYWLFGDPGIVGQPGLQDPPHLDLSKPSAYLGGKEEPALFLALRYENTNFDYTSRSDNPAANKGQVLGNYLINSLGLGANYWASRHVRLSLNALYYWVDGVAVDYRAPNKNHWEAFARLAVAM
jgi:phosphate-selective porin